MDLGILTDNKLLSLALHGYGPFNPEIGIFCGGYQGILYPQPTTLSYPGFDPYLHTEANATNFTPNKRYEGLGIGNPGINYTNAGHMLGILDTFGRMSYGIGVLQAIANGEDGSTLIGPAVDLLLPLVINSDFSSSPVRLGDIYPSLIEIPSSYINSFSIGDDGKAIPDPRPSVEFPTLGLGLSPSVNVVDKSVMQNLFSGKSIFSYLGMTQYFRSIIDAMSESAQSLTTEATHTFSLNDDEQFNKYLGINFFENALGDVPSKIVSTGNVVTKCEVMGATQALRTLTNSSVYHNGADGQNEYRSLTELNSVINLVPLQMIGASYSKYYTITSTDDGEPAPDGAGGLRIASYAIFDFVINVSDVPPDPNDPSPGSVTIAGNVTIKSLVSNIDALNFTSISQQMPNPISNIFIPGWRPNLDDGSFSNITYTANETVKRHAEIQISSRNNVSWDKEWLGGESVNEDSGFSDTDTLHRDAQVSEFAPTLNTDPLVVPFSQTVRLGRGVTSIRLRVFARSMHLLTHDFLFLNIWENPFNSNGPRGIMPEPGETCHEHLVLDGITFVLDWHCHPYLGILNNFFLGSPLEARDDIREQAISLSLTVNGTRLDEISYEMST